MKNSLYNFYRSTLTYTKKNFLNTRINYFLLAVRHCIVFKKNTTIYVSK